MSKYKQYEHLPWWLSTLDHHTLTPTEKEVLDLDYYCKTHGTKLSHQAAADEIHRSRQRVYETRRRLEQLGLRRTEPAKGSFKLGHPIEYPNEADFFEQLRARGVDPRRLKNKRKSFRETPPKGGLSLQGAAEPLPKNPAEKEQPTASNAGGLNDFGSGMPTVEPASKSVREACTWKVYYLAALANLKKTIKDPCRAERIARVTADRKLKRRG